jgi:TRAP-type C4-dicarboxylate transport system permease small subunit
VILGAGVLLLFIAILVRLVRRIRGRHDAPAETVEAADPVESTT